jgi:hypothetical protein
MRDRSAADIGLGSIWCRGDGTCAIVRSVNARHVTFTDHVGAIDTFHVNRFREVFVESPYDARDVRSQFSMSVANLDSFHAFWSPSQKRMFARSAACRPEDVRTAARGRPPLPPDAEFIGTYAGKIVVHQGWKQRVMCSVDAFFDDLNDRLIELFRALGRKVSP